VPVCERSHPRVSARDASSGKCPCPVRTAAYLGRKGGRMAQTAERRAVVRCVFCQTPNRVDLTKLSLGPKCASCHRPILLDRPLKVAGADFDQTLQGTTVPVAVDFYADWWGPCHMMAPMADELAKLHAGEALVLKLDTDVDPAIAG